MRKIYLIYGDKCVFLQPEIKEINRFCIDAEVNH